MPARTPLIPLMVISGLALGAATALGGMAGAPQGPWVSPSYGVSVFPQPADDPQLASAPNGSVAFVWEGWDGADWQIRTRNRTPGGVMQGIRTLSAAGASHEDPRVATGPDGTTAVAWKNMREWNRVVQVRIQKPGASLGSTQTLSSSTGDATEDRVAVGPQGQTVVAWAWNTGDGRVIQTRTRSAGSKRFAPTTTLSARGGDAIDPQIAIAPDGTVTIAWERASASGASVIQVSTRRPGEHFGKLSQVSKSGGAATDVALGVDASGMVTTTWERVAPKGVVIQARRGQAGQGMGPITDLSTHGVHASDSDLGVGPDGTVTVLWEFDSTARDLKIVQSRTLPAGGTWASIETLSRRATSRPDPTSAPDVDDPVIAVAGDGTATGMWKQVGSNGQVRIQTRTRPAGGTWGPATWLSASNREADEPRLTVAPSGVVTGVWKLATGHKVVPEQNFWLQGMSTATPAPG
ncbi:MAG: hypothetical protein WCK40_09460 [Thermoleophilia bacterium]